jgi:hypothetical protein
LHANHAGRSILKNDVDAAVAGLASYMNLELQIAVNRSNDFLERPRVAIESASILSGETVSDF